MIPNNYLQLVDKIEQATQKRRVNWLTTNDSQLYRLDIGESTITVRFGYKYMSASPLDEPMNCVYVSILNVDGDEIDDFSSDETEKDYSILSNLYENAKRNALKIDETVSGILKELDSLLS